MPPVSLPTLHRGELQDKYAGAGRLCWHVVHLLFNPRTENDTALPAGSPELACPQSAWPSGFGSCKSRTPAHGCYPAGRKLSSLKTTWLHAAGRPGAGMAPVSLPRLHRELQDKYAGAELSRRDVLSAAMYPAVFDEYMCAWPVVWHRLVRWLLHQHWGSAFSSDAVCCTCWQSVSSHGCGCGRHVPCRPGKYMCAWPLACASADCWPCLSEAHSSSALALTARLSRQHRKTCSRLSSSICVALSLGSWVEICT